MSKKKILVIDDEDFIRELVKDFLEIDDVGCEGVGEIESALALLREQQFNLILLDRHLGEMKADDVIARIKEIAPYIPIVILTGDPQCDHDYLKQVGADGIIFKPFQVSDFMDSVNTYLEI
jgi:two-component system alkaline phosphatase synthesis response regulator PhoP